MAGAAGFTPESAIWRVSREWALMLGGGRALLLQAAHPLALAGVMEHSDYERDVWGRLRSTMAYVWGVIYGTQEEAERIGARVRAVHKTVHGTIPHRMGVPGNQIPPTYADFKAYWRTAIDSDVICVTPEAMELARATVMRPPLPAVLRPAWEAVNFVSAGFLPRKLREGYGFTWTPAHRALLAGSAAYVKRAVVPLLPDLARALPAARRAERLQLAA